MTRELLTYIRKHEYIYNFLRDDSSHYKYLYEDNRYIEVIKKLAKENLKRKRTIVQNILLSSFENYDTTTLLSKEEINQGFMTELDKHVKVKTK